LIAFFHLIHDSVFFILCLISHTFKVDHFFVANYHPVYHKNAKKCASV
jgi:hypothetical protein